VFLLAVICSMDRSGDLPSGTLRVNVVKSSKIPLLARCHGGIALVDGAERKSCTKLAWT